MKSEQNQLTQEQKCIRILEFMGWTTPKGWSGYWPHRLDLRTVTNKHVPHGVPPGKTQERYTHGCSRQDNLEPAPDLFNDLNACQEMEKYAYATQPSGWAAEYEEALSNICSNAQYPHWFTWCATAAQRAEAFGRAMKLWENQES